MERQAQQTDRAIARLAMTTDQVGTPQQARNISAAERALRSYGGEADRVGSRTRRLTRDMDQHVTRWQRLRNAIITTGAALGGLRNMMRVLAIPAIGLAIGVLAQAIGALAGGIIALLPRLVDLSGAFAALPATLAGVGLALGTVKLAFNDLGKAMGGNKNALKALTPEARSFLTTLKQYQPVVRDLRRSAQQGLFPGLEYSVRRLQRAVPTVQRLVGTMGRHIGAAASSAANRFTTVGFLQDFEGIGRQGVQMFDRFAGALVNVVDGLRHLTMAARPFTEWIGTLIERFGVWFRDWAQFGRDSGRFATFLERTRRSMTQFGHLLENIWNWFRGLGRAARPLGDMLWRDAERATRSWAKYSNSVAGQLRLTRQFLQMHDAVEAIVTLFDNLVRALFRMGTSEQLPRIATALSNMVDNLEAMFNMFVRVFGPVTADLLNEFVRTLTFLTSVTGPINVMLSLLARILQLINDLITAIPGLSHVLSTALSVATIGLFINKVRTLAASWWAVVTGARAAAGAQAGATGVAAGGVLMGGGMRGGAAGRFGRAGAGLAAFGRVAIPVAAAMGIYGGATAEGGWGQRSRQFLSGLTFGIYNPPTFGEIREQRLQRWQQQIAGGLERFGGQQPRTLGQVQGSLRYLQGIGFPGGGPRTPEGRALMVGIREEIRVRRILLGTLVREKNQRDRALGTQRVRQIGQAFDIYAARFGPQEAFGRTRGEIARQMSELGPAGRRVLGRAVLSWAQQMEKEGRPGFKGATRMIRQDVEAAFKTMGEQVRVTNRGIFTGSQKEWNAIRVAISNPAERARQAVVAAFTAIQVKAVGSLQAMGFTAAQARRLVAGMERTGVTPTSPTAPGPASGLVRGPDPLEGGRGRASGGRIWAPGYGMGDSVALGNGQLGAKGELVVNRHTERKVNYLLGGRTTLGGLVANEGRAHGSFARGGRGQAFGLQPGISAIASEVTGRFPGLYISSGARPQGRPSSYHYSGMAVDLAGSSTVMSAAARWVGANIGRSLLEGIHNPNLSIKNGAAVAPSFWGAKTWAGHRDHIHLAAGGLGARGGVAGMPGGIGQITLSQLYPGPSGLRGVPGVLADQAGLLMATGATARLNQMLGGMTGMGTPTAADWYKQGADFVARKPMLIGVGDTEERVQITPTHRRTRDGRPIVLQVNIDKIENHRDGDIRKIVHHEFDLLADELGLTMFVGDEETIR
jgi:hypothetical protein